ncbi:DNA-directed RNA polymerase specialized sigma24 family protein [Bradyrhizobium sp. LM3.2]
MPTSTRSSPAPTCRRGCSRSCATCSAPTIASGGGKSRIAEGNYAKTLKTQPSQNAHLEFEEFRTALDKLPQDQREALILVGASGFSYEDAASICGCAVGTIKSRVNRARSKLAALLYVDGAEDFGPDETIRAVIGGSGG